MSELAPYIKAIDLDYNILDTDLYFDKLSFLIVRSGLTNEATLRATRTKVEDIGETFNIDRYLKGMDVAEDQISDLYRTMSENKDGDKFLYADAVPYLRAHQKLRIPSLFFTFGPPETQLPKLRAITPELEAAGIFNFPYLITAEKDKGVEIAKWKQPEGHYEVITDDGQSLAGRIVMLDDDKSSSYDSLPDDCGGNKNQRFDEERPSQIGPRPARVQLHRGLTSIADGLRGTPRLSPDWSAPIGE